MAGTDKFITVNGLKLHYVEHGDRRNPSFLCLHGVSMHGHSWDTLAAQISDRYHVLALTARGHGDSERADGYQGMAYVEDTAAFIEATGSAPAVVCGLSLGGGVSLGLAALNPDKVAKLIVVDAGPRSNPEGSERITRAFATSPTEMESVEEAMEACRRGLGVIPESELRHYAVHATVQGEDGKLRWKIDPKIRQQRVETGTSEGSEASAQEQENLLWAACAAIKCPTLIIRGSHSDILDRETAERMVESIPDARLVEVDSGHAVPLENAMGFYEALKDFI
jgi:pimeloyl-ACP methyl ester carboxylesterase